MENKEEKVTEENVLDIVKSREIVKEIMDYGVNDLQIRKIIKFLSLELEDRETMINICNALEDNPAQKPKIEI